MWLTIKYDNGLYNVISIEPYTTGKFENKRIDFTYNILDAFKTKQEAFDFIHYLNGGN